MKPGHGSFLQFIATLLKLDKDAVVPKKSAFLRRRQRKANQFDNTTNVSQIQSPTQPPKPFPRRTDFSSSSDVHIARERGEMPTRALWRKMMRIRHRAER